MGFMTLNINSNKRKNYGEIEQVQPYIKQNKMTPDRVAETLASSNSIDYTPERMIRLVSSNDRSNSDVKAVLAFLSQKGTPSQKKKLFVDCINKNYKTIALELLSKGIVSPESENDETLLELAEEYGCLKLIKYCWPFLFKKKSGQSFEETVLSLAISKGNIKIANKLLDLFDIHSGSGFKLFRVLISVKNSNLENFLNIENIRDKILKGVKSFPHYVRARFVK